jgi:hypothetical protein
VFLPVFFRGFFFLSGQYLCRGACLRTIYYSLIV